VYNLFSRCFKSTIPLLPNGVEFESIDASKLHYSYDGSMKETQNKCRQMPKSHNIFILSGEKFWLMSLEYNSGICEKLVNL
jgi:hypothetical protein